ncbi:hypothetical protein B0T16DRAFT_95217 [Cercophora newfieldiana]|uniref:Zn(2)-C6 fungal-type domain-containing protein n=1 Tax=Cercophora newfieldiana TaxID=92897 RepID=A0AA39YHM7_9PEZI|nr:hypothetical protein B0T16DRAFT_95217 [Cercophora newfieldiana]
MAGIEATKRAPGNEAKDPKPESDTKPKDHQAPAADDEHKTPKKRRKVNHACLYCRRSHMTCDLERPCTRCIKRNIGHLCHDEPRDHESRKAKSVIAPSTAGESDVQSQSQPDLGRSAMDTTAAAAAAGSMGPPAFDTSISSRPAHAAKSAFDAAALAPGNPLQLVQPTAVSSIQANSTMSQFAFPDNWLASQNHYHDMHNFHPNYQQMPPEVTNEFNLLNEFLQTSLLDDGGLVTDDQNPMLGNNSNPSDPFARLQNTTGLLPPSALQGGPMPPPNNDQGKSISRPASALPADKDKTREYYFLEAADPHGNDTPEHRMTGILQAKHDAGLLQPFSYIAGYARLSKYLDTHVTPTSKQKILRQIERFRPKFRERIQHLTTIDLLGVEFWFEQSLMECDRLFASMAIPACCWRRTGEIFRGNKEMAELINVPVESLQGGKIALHQILTEDSNVRYWEEFGTIAFDQAHDSLITACSLKSPDDKSDHPVINCCFSFRIRRDNHKIPCLIVGNFLPHDP